VNAGSSPSPEKIHVGVVDDHQVLVDALSMTINAQQDMQCVGTAIDCTGGLELVLRYQPQVLILDVRLPDGDGIELVPDIHRASAETNIVILTSLNDEASILRAMQSGVSGFLNKSRGMQEVLGAIRRAEAGEIVMPPSLLAGMLNRTRAQFSNAERAGAINRVTLTLRELEILKMMAMGEPAERIAERLVISPATARTHIRNLMQKLNAHTQLQAVTYALKVGLIEPPV
jgi:DNA-binding NarL/FixJ family response regulator